MIFILGGTWIFYEMAFIQPAGDWFETQAINQSRVSLPKDDAPHQGRMEWWYYNGHLKTESGRYFSFHHATFTATDLIRHLVKHVSLSDHQTGQHFIDQRKTTDSSHSGEIPNSFNFEIGNWKVSGSNGNDRIDVSTQDFSLTLTLTSTRPPILHGDQGIIVLDQAGSSYYYSRTRMAISGTLTIGNKTEKVDGSAWFDHQWGDFTTTRLAWDWFSLQLNDGSDLMLYRLRDDTGDPVLYTGSISKNGITEVLDATDFMITPGKRWTSKITGYTYPVTWKVEIPKKHIAIETYALIANSEFDARLTTYNVYWEGAVDIKGSHTGQGFVELYGYNHEKH
jgi:predicted secreted hydrolase